MSLTAHSVGLFHTLRRLGISCFSPSWNRGLAHLIEFDETLNGLLCADLLGREDTLKCIFCNETCVHKLSYPFVQRDVSSPKLIDDGVRLSMMLGFTANVSQTV